MKCDEKIKLVVVDVHFITINILACTQGFTKPELFLDRAGLFPIQYIRTVPSPRNYLLLIVIISQETVLMRTICANSSGNRLAN